MDKANEKMLDEKYPEGYFDHYIAMFQYDANEDAFRKHAITYIQIEGIECFSKLIKEIQLINSNNDWSYFVEVAKFYGVNGLNSENIQEFGNMPINIQKENEKGRICN